MLGIFKMLTPSSSIDDMRRNGAHQAISSKELDMPPYSARSACRGFEPSDVEARCSPDRR
jgi:hypothetical protein